MKRWTYERMVSWTAKKVSSPTNFLKWNFRHEGSLEMAAEEKPKNKWEMCIRRRKK